ncbi:MAG: DUF3025 domain-containing protein [Xanthomonadales bacterium]|nr:DUF3025 domain-containing protein [Xanthomonadales bacterium]
MSWRAKLDLDHPCWRGYRALIRALPGDGFPLVESLNTLLPATARTWSGHAVRFVAERDAAPGEYEARIDQGGQVSTRADSWHDLFNALAWARFPRIKAAINGLHLRHRDAAAPDRRGPVRDALTLFDEGGGLLVSDSSEALHAVAEHDWQTVFGGQRPWQERFRFRILGHGLLDKCRAPYRAMTANVLLLHVSADHFRLPSEKLTVMLDRAVAQLMRRTVLPASTSALSPLPVAGIPGWSDRPARELLADTDVFRPRAAHRPIAPVVQLSSA